MNATLRRLPRSRLSDKLSKRDSCGAVETEDPVCLSPVKVAQPDEDPSSPQPLHAIYSDRLNFLRLNGEFLRHGSADQASMLQKAVSTAAMNQPSTR